MKKIKEIQDRKKLGEGRNYGIGFSILKKIKKDTFETYNAFTACRDYLNDFIYCENAKEEIGDACGYNHKILNCFDNQNVFYLGVNSLQRQRDGKYEDLDKHQELLITNYKNLESLLNVIETKLNLDVKSSIELDEETLIITAPIYWTKSTALISVYSLIIRCFFDLNIIATNENIDGIIETKKPFITADVYYTQYIKQFYKHMLEADFVNIDYTIIMSYSKNSVHSFGIQGVIQQLKLK